MSDNDKESNTETSTSEDKRRHTRVSLRAYADLHYSTKKWEAHILDLSESGARLAILGEHLLQKDDPLRVQIQLDDKHSTNTANKTLNLHGKLIHVREHLLGLEFQPDTPADKALLSELIIQVDKKI